MNAPRFHFGAALSALALGSVFASCATQAQYDEAVAQAKYHQTRVHECERENARLQDDVQRLQGSLAMSDVNAVDSDYPADFQSRISELQARIDGLGRPLQDIERFDVEGGYVLMIQDKILFASGSATLNSSGQATVRQELVRRIQAQPHGRVWVRGHTDSDPVARPETKAKFPHGNLQLSASRAVEVAALLIASGVDAQDVAIAGFGPHDPVKRNDSSENKRLNRRVEIFVSDVGS
jgi:flagellar motor protein MotB